MSEECADIATQTTFIFGELLLRLLAATIVIHYYCLCY